MLLIILVSCQNVQELKRPIWRDDVGLSRDVTDNSAALQELLDLGKPIYVESGIYNFTTPVFTDKPFSIIGIGEVVFNVPPDFMQCRNYSFSPQVRVSNDTIYTNDEFDYIALEQEEDLPGIRGRGTAVLLKPFQKINNGYLLREQALFDIDSTFINKAYNNASGSIKNIKFYFDPVNVDDYAISIWGYNLTMDGVSFLGSNGQLGDGASIYGCPSVTITNGYYQSLRYGLLINNCTNVRVIRSDVFDCRHLAALATWTKDVFISDVYAEGCRTVIESHVAYNVHYDNIKSRQTDQINLRGFGSLKITDSEIYTTNEVGNETSYSLLGYHFTSDLIGTKYEYLLDQTDIVFDGVKYKEQIAGKFRGLTASGYKTLTINNCESSALGGYENYTKDASVRIINSKTGMLQLNKCSYGIIDVRDILIDAEMSPVNYIIERNASVPFVIDGLRITNGSCCYLLSVWNGVGQYPSKLMTFINSYGALKGLAGSFTGGSNAYHRIHLIGSELTFNENLGLLFGGNKPEQFITTNGSVLTFNNKTLSDQTLHSIN